MGGSKSSLGFLVLLLIVLFSGTSSVASGPLPPQANTTCWQEDNGHISGQLCLINGCCRVYHPGGRQMKGKSENNRTVTFKVFKENCRLCYQAFLERCGEMLNTTGDCVPRKPLTGALLASGLSLCLASFVLLLFTLEPRDQTLGIPSLSTSYADTVAAPSRVSCEI